jgi:hypothetical protein
LELTQDETFILETLKLPFPTTPRAAFLMIDSIASLTTEHNEKCCGLHTFSYTENTLHHAMWFRSPGTMKLVYQKTIHDSIFKSSKSISIGSSDSTTSKSSSSTQNKYITETIMEKEKQISVEQSLTIQEGDPSLLSPEQESDIITLASDLVLSRIRETFDEILRAPPLGTLWRIKFNDKAERIFRRWCLKNRGAFVPVLKNILLVGQGTWYKSVAVCNWNHFLIFCVFEMRFGIGILD